MKLMKYTTLMFALRIVPAAIMLQTLFFKFSANAESVYIFSTLNMEPEGRIGSGIVELIAGILLLVPRTAVWGALLGVCMMTGAIVSHITVLGIEVQNDGGQLFIYAVIAWTCCFTLTFLKRHTISQNFKIRI